MSAGLIITEILIRIAILLIVIRIIIAILKCCSGSSKEDPIPYSAQAHPNRVVVTPSPVQYQAPQGIVVQQPGYQAYGTTQPMQPMATPIGLPPPQPIPSPYYNQQHQFGVPSKPKY